jgi:hypothetical protein
LTLTSDTEQFRTAAEKKDAFAASFLYRWLTATLSGCHSG